MVVIQTPATAFEMRTLPTADGWKLQPRKIPWEGLINSDLPAEQGCAAIFDDYKSLKMKERENRAFLFPYSENSQMELFRVFLKFIGKAQVIIQTFAFLGNTNPLVDVFTITDPSLEFQLFVDGPLVTRFIQVGIVAKIR